MPLPAVPRATAAELSAAIDRGIATGNLLVVDDAFLAALTVAAEMEAPPDAWDTLVAGAGYDRHPADGCSICTAFPFGSTTRT